MNGLLRTHYRPGPLDKGDKSYFPGEETETPKVYLTKITE